MTKRVSKSLDAHRKKGRLGHFYRTMEQGKKEPVVIKFADNDEMSYKVDCIKQFFDFCYDF